MAVTLQNCLNEISTKPEEVEMDPGKVKTILEWEPP